MRAPRQRAGGKDCAWAQVEYPDIVEYTYFLALHTL